MRSGAVMPHEDGNENQPIIIFPEGWEIQDTQLPHPAPERRAAATMIADDESELPLTVPVTVTGWEIQSWQPPHFAPERRSVVIGDDGDLLPLFYPFFRFETGGGFSKKAIQNANQRGAAIYGKSQFAVPSAVSWGWAIQPVDLRIQQRASFLPAATEIELPPALIPVPSAFSTANSEQFRYSAGRAPSGALKGRTQFAILSPWVVTGFDQVDTITAQNIQTDGPYRRTPVVVGASTNTALDRPDRPNRIPPFCKVIRFAARIDRRRAAVDLGI
jgi:hypothetical protein